MIALIVQLTNKANTLVNIWIEHRYNTFLCEVNGTIRFFQNHDVKICGDFIMVIDRDIECDNYIQINNSRTEN